MDFHTNLAVAVQVFPVLGKPPRDLFYRCAVQIPGAYPAHSVVCPRRAHGNLSGGHVRDKDAVNASMLACEMTAWYRAKGMTLADAMRALYADFGCYQNSLASFTFEGADGMAKMGRIMDTLRTTPPQALAGRPVTKVVDYLTGEGGALNLPRSNVLEFQLAGSKVLVRPSGTEPKINPLSNLSRKSVLF